ncbi:MAG: domain protein putative component of TonB system [Schlesneria sp.]|nr:domain protein putative component of TonB system [Schlesneria sp.]
MRRLNLRRVAILMVAVIMVGGATHLLHGYQMSRIASVFLREARRAEAEHRPAEALRDLRNYIKLAPDDIEGLALYGKQLAELGRVEPAYMTLEKVLRNEPERADVRRTLVRLAMQLARFPEARSNLDELLKQSPEDSELWELKGICLFSQSEYVQAQEMFKTAIANSPDRLGCYGLLASLQTTKLKNPAAATACINQMVASNPENFQAYLNRGLWLLQQLNQADATSEPRENKTTNNVTARQDKLKEITADAQRAREFAPESADVLAFCARVAIAQQSYDEARQTIEKGLELHRTDSRFYLALSDVETATANPKSALEALKRGVAAVPRDRDLRWNLANYLIDQRATAEVATEIDQLRIAGQPPELIGYLEARLLIQAGQWLDAIQRLDTIRPRLQDWPNLVKQTDVLLAKAYRETDSADQQLACYRRAVTLDPQWIPGRVGLAEALLAGNFVRQASDEYRRILSIPGAPPAAGIELAKCLFRLTARQSKSEQDWSEFDDVLSWVERQTSHSTQVSILRAEKLVAMGLNDKAAELIAEAKSQNDGEIDLWIVQTTLAQLAREWDQVEQCLTAAEQKFGDNVTLRIVKGRYLMHRYGAKASDTLKQVAQPSPNWTDQEQFVFVRNFAMMFLAIGDFPNAEEQGRLGATLQPTDLSIRLLLFDVALRAKQPKLMGEILEEVKRITGEGPLWHYGEAVRLTLLSELSPNQELLSQARFHLVKAKTQRPAWVRIPLLFAEVETQSGDLSAAIEQLQEAIITLGERSPVILSKTVSLLFSQRRFIEADQIVRRLQERQSLVTSDMIRSASEISMRLNDTSRALDLAEQLARESDSAGDKVWLAQVLGVLGRQDEAEQQLRKVIESDSNAPEAWIALVQVLVRANQLEKAENVVIEAEKAMTKDQASLAVAQCYELIGKTDLARSRYQTALEQAPDNMVVIRRIVEFQLKTGRAAEIEPLLRKIVNNGRDKSTDRDRRWATQQLAIALSNQGTAERMTEALTLIDRNLASGFKTTTDQRVKALILARQPSVAQRREAIDILQKLLTHESDTAVEDRFLLARLCLTVGDRSKARSEFRTLLGSNGGDARFIAAYLQLLLDSDETTDAENWLDKLQKVAPDDLRTADLRAQFLFGKGRYPEAIAFVKEASQRTFPENRGGERVQPILWGAKRLEEFALKLSKSKKGALKTEEVASFTAEAKLLYEQFATKGPLEKLTLAEFYSHIDQVDLALEILEQNTDAAPPQFIAAICIGVMKNARTTPPQLARLQQLIQAATGPTGNKAVLTLVLADLMSWRTDYDGAVRLYTEVLQRDPNNIPALNNLAVILAMTGRDSKEAMRLIQQAIELTPQKAALLDTRGLVYLAANGAANALADFEASTKEGESSERYFHIALACAQLKQTEAAKRALNRAIDQGLVDQTLHPLERPLYANLRATLGQ